MEKKDSAHCCPHCGRKISLLKCWILKTQGEYRCPKCGGYSNIVLHPILIFFAFAAFFISTVIFLIQWLILKTFSWPILLLVFLPYFLFYLSSVFLVRFRKLQTKKRPPEGEKFGLKIEPPEAQSRSGGIQPPDDRAPRGSGISPPAPAARKRRSTLC